ncbi:uncharacterized protein G2W53_035776 [Senna tora]|uniref:Uncharacterized protein n=1 Tax=Senna tora TaxID=362788 RepID=A0A834SR58_9FABA|nr:uncharacterized protein G2W53_035776 [Senna tora]
MGKVTRSFNDLKGEKTEKVCGKDKCTKERHVYPYERTPRGYVGEVRAVWHRSCVPPITNG